jgi:uroporphyrin-III C-methyltransferase
MLLDLDVGDRRVVIFGEEGAAATAARRFARAGARVRLVGVDPAASDDALPDVARIPQPAASDTAALLRILAPAWLVVTAGPPSELGDRVRLMCNQLNIVHTHQAPAVPDRLGRPGRVALVGGGPGTNRLLTLEACEALLDADVVFYDRLAPTADLARLAPGAELVDVGKLPYHHPTSQDRIQELIIERARGGQSVVRLKGGDPFVFGRGGEEIRACRAAGVEVRVVPGVTSAIAVPAAAGIPVTHRGASRAFTVLSGHLPPSPAELESLARLGGTVVILMGMASLTQTVSGLVAAGLPPDTPAAIVERGFSDSQRTTTGRLAELPGLVGRVGVTSPAVVVIGEVAAFAAEQVGADPLTSRFSLPSHPGR